MALFGTVLPSDSDVVDGYINGLREANSGFLEAVIRYSDIFDQFHFFCAENDCCSRQAAWDTWLSDHQLDNKTVTVFPLQYLPASLASQDYDLFYSGDPYISYLLELRDAFAGRLFPVVGRAHALSQDISLGSWRSLLNAPSHACDTIVCSSQASVQVIENLLKEAGRRSSRKFSGQLVRVPLGVDTRVPHAMDPKEAREILGLPAEGTILLCLGRLSPIDKADLHPLLLTIADLKDRKGIEDCYLYICGQAGSDDDYIVSLSSLAGQLGIDDQVLFNFELLPLQKSQAFQAADIFISLVDSVQESFGIAPVEAMAAGLPVVLSDWDGYRELIGHGTHGLLIPTLWGKVDGLSAPSAFFEPQKAHLIQAQSVAVDLPELTNCLEKLIKTPSFKEEMGRNASDRARTLYDWEVVIGLFDGLAKRCFQQVPDAVQKPSGRLHAMHFGKIFSGYATDTLSESCEIQTSFYGRQALAGGFIPVRFEGLGAVISGAVFLSLMKNCLRSQSVKNIRVDLSLARAQVDAMVLWGVKHGLLTCSFKNKGRGKPPIQYLVKGVTERLISNVCKQYKGSNHQGLIDVLTVEKERLSALAPTIGCHNNINQVAGNYPLWGRYLRKRLFGITQGYKLLLDRITTSQIDLCTLLSTESLSVSLIRPLSDKGYRGACSVMFSNGRHIVYKHGSYEMAAAVYDGKLLKRFNTWCGWEVFAPETEVLSKSDQKGSFSFHLYRDELSWPVGENLYELGLLSAFALCFGMSDLHLNNIKFCEKGFCPIDLDMICHPEVLERLFHEVFFGQFPECWSESSLALTRIELLWDELLQSDWKLVESDIEEVISGFEYGFQQVTMNVDEWKRVLCTLVNNSCHNDPVPFNSSLPVLEQMEAYDLFSVPDLKTLKQDIAVQVRRTIKQLDSPSPDSELVSTLVNCWLGGQHYQGVCQPGVETEIRIKGIAGKLPQAGKVVRSWLSALYREWLMERNGLTEYQ